MDESASVRGSSRGRTDTTSAHPSDGHKPDRAVAVFFVLAYSTAWGTWAILAVLAADAGIGTADFIAQIEAGDLTTATPAPTWLLYLLTRVIDFAFSIAGVVMIAVTAGTAGLRHLAGRLVRWRIAGRWYLLALTPVVMYGAAALLATASTNGPAEFTGATLTAIAVSPSAGLLVSLFLRGAMGEELGLRGFALPRLQQRMSPFAASGVIGVLWGLWHLPVLVGRDMLSVVAFLLLVVALSFVLTWLFNGSGGSLIPPLLFHATQNWEEAYETVLPAIVGTDWELLAILGMLVVGVTAGVVVRRVPGRAVTELAPGNSTRI